MDQLAVVTNLEPPIRSPDLRNHRSISTVVVRPEQLARARGQLKLPGRAWLELEVVPDTIGRLSVDSRVESGGIAQARIA